MGRGGLKCYDLVERYEFTVTPKSAKWRTITYLAPKSAIRQKMVVSIDYDGTVQLMDSESYELYEVNQSHFGDDVQQGNTIDVLQIDSKLYAVPRLTDSSE
jgi:NMD protein affecting ribosome stability and mRNA decay